MLTEVKANSTIPGSPERLNICALIVTYNIGGAVHQCVGAIINQVGHVLIIDNASGESTRQALNSLADSDSITIILNERNEGIAHAYNQAVSWARENEFGWILTLDHDSVATLGMVDELVRGFNALVAAGTMNAAIMAANPFDENIRQYLFYPPREGGGLPLYEGEVLSSGSLIWLGVFDSVGTFNEDLFIYYVDADFCRRVTRNGYGIYLCPEALLLHREGTKRQHKFLWISACYDHYGVDSRYYITRNTIYMMKTFPLRREGVLSLIARLWVDHRNILLFDEDRWSLMRHSFRGLIDGLRGKIGMSNSKNHVD